MSSKTTSHRSNPPKRTVQTRRAQENLQRASMGGGAPNPAEMQQRLGNRGTQAWLAEQGAAQPLQAKLTVGEPDDMYEQEADRVAETVMRMPEEEETEVQAKPIANQITPLVRRMPEEAVEEEPIVQQMSEPESEEDEESVVAQRMSDTEPQEGDEEEEIAQVKRETAYSPDIHRQMDEDEEEEIVQAKPLIQRQSTEEEEETIQAKQFPSHLPPQVPSTIPGANNSPNPSIQRLCTECKEEMQRQPEEEEELAQTKPLADHQFVAREPSVQPKDVRGQTPQVSSDTAANIDSLKGSGHPLPQSARSFFEPRFGADFSQVRVHTDTRATETAKSINARAFTAGKEIAFGASQYAPESHEGRQLLAHELTHVVQQQAGQLQIQRRTDPVVLENPRSGGQACLLHLHGDEKAALRVVKDLYNSFCVNLAYIDHPGRRLLRVDVPGHPGVTCQADPNRIFDDAAIVSTWKQWNRGRCLRDPIKSDAQQAIEDYRDNQLNPKIRQCRGQALSQGNVSGTGIVGNLPISVFHNNRDVGSRPARQRSRDLTIRSYLPRGREAGATETDRSRLRPAFTILRSNPGLSNPQNPHIEASRDIDDFILVTDPNDFVSLVRNRRNVVLQSQSPPNDGSLSVILSSGRYINVEAQRRSRLTIQQTMGEEALSALGVTRLPCTTPSGSSAGMTSSEHSSSTTQPTSPVVGGQVQRKELTAQEQAPMSPSRLQKSLKADETPSIKRTNMTQLPEIFRSPTLTGVIQLLGNPITESDLPSPGEQGISSQEQTLRRFMREVYRRQVALWTAQGSAYLHEILPAEIVSLPGSYVIPGKSIQVHKDIEHPVTNMLDDAGSALRRANTPGGPAAGIRKVGIRSGYRPAASQFSIWTRWAPEYYRRTTRARRDNTRFPGGEHSDAAAQFLAEYTNQRVFSPGYSPHQHGRTIDVSYEDSTHGWAEAKTSGPWFRRWQSSWFFGWLQGKAARYGFFQNPNLNEPWHWEFSKVLSSISRIIQLLLDLLEPLIGQRRLWLGGERIEEAPGEETNREPNLETPQERTSPGNEG